MPLTTPDMAVLATPDATATTREAALDPALSREWTPLLLGAARARALALVEEIATALSEPASTNDPSLSGAAARALFFAYFAEASPGRELSSSVDDALIAAIDGIARTRQTFSLCEGFVGVGWVAQHLVGRFDDNGEDANSAIDDALATVTERATWSGAYELLYGLGGIGVYALERIARPSGRQLLAQVVTRLDELAERHPGGVAWRTAPSPASAVRTTNAALGHYDCGVAHGVPGLVPLLAGACAAGVEVARARPLLDGAVRWLLRQASDDVLTYPAWIADGKRTPTRLAWCYGDAGIAATLLAAGSAVNEAAWIDAAASLGRRAAALGRDEAAAQQLAVLDSGICHGSAGLAIIFHRLWQHAHEPVFADAARWWYGRVLDDHRPGRGIGGYKMWQPPGHDPQPAWIDDDSLLTGVAGVGLALLAGTGSIEPAWDRVLTASLPSR